MPKVLRESLSMQDWVCCDYIRTPAIFWMPDIYRSVGDLEPQQRAWQRSAGENC